MDSTDTENNNYEPSSARRFKVRGGPSGLRKAIGPPHQPAFFKVYSNIQQFQSPPLPLPGGLAHSADLPAPVALLPSSVPQWPKTCFFLTFSAIGRSGPFETNGCSTFTANTRLPLVFQHFQTHNKQTILL